MKAKNLAELLMQNPELEVMQHGYEGGYSIISNLEVSKMVLDVNNSWYYGKHEKYDYDRKEEFECHEKIDAVIIG